MTLVTVGIPTIGRKSLTNTLQSLACQRLPHGLDVEILVIDDTEDLQVMEAHREQSSTNVRVLGSGEQNIARARNICLEQAQGDFILFIDDDEVAPPDWVAEMVKQMEASRADCLFAPVRPVYRPDAPDWLTNIEPLFPEELKTAQKRSRIIGRTGNSILRKSFIEDQGLKFDTSYRLAGEDLHFFHLCQRRGARTMTVDRPALEEHVCARYHRVKPVLEKLFRRGTAYADVHCSLSRSVVRDHVTMTLVATLKLTSTMVALPASVLFGRLAWRRLTFRAALELGKLNGLLHFLLERKRPIRSEPAEVPDRFPSSTGSR